MALCCRALAPAAAHRIVEQGALSHASSAISWRFLRRFAPVSRYNQAAKPRAVSRPTRSPPSYNTICIATQPGQTLCELAADCPACRPAVSWRRLSRVVAESWPCRGPLATPRPHLPSPVSRFKLLYRDPVQLKMGSSPATFLHLSFFFFSSSFFFSFQLLENHPKKILFFFSFSSKPNKFIKIYFIHFFFPVLHTVKP